ncbi:MAG TPA: Bax inhibitor-1 family protein [Thermoanaerobaculia bacterium]|nr:Bax inhibitor-1 family protein [Thermoanaerobaculia bacterium]
MSYDQGSRGYDPIQPAFAADSRARFVARTYTHLLGAIAAFTVLEVVLFRSGIAASIAEALLGTNWLFVLGGFLVVSWIASRIAHTVESVPAQYAALGAFVLAEAIIFVPLIYIAEVTAPGVVRSAAAVTLFGFAGLTAVALITRKDFSFLRGVLMWGGIVALVLIVAGALFGFELGTFFSVAMVALAGAAILYDTSNVIHHFREDRYVAAALELFASVALMFWYVIRLFLSRD